MDSPEPQHAQGGDRLHEDVGGSRGPQFVELTHRAKVRNRHVRIQGVHELTKRSRECRGIGERLHDEHQLLVGSAACAGNTRCRSAAPQPTRTLVLRAIPTTSTNGPSTPSLNRRPDGGVSARPVARRGSFVDDGDERGIWSIGPSKRAAGDYAASPSCRSTLRRRARRSGSRDRRRAAVENPPGRSTRRRHS